MAKFENKRKKNIQGKKPKKKVFSVTSCSECPYTGKCRFTFNNPACNSKRKKIDEGEKVAA
jgi:hypothetical protein